MTSRNRSAQAKCQTCASIGWIEEVHPAGELARILPCPDGCDQGQLMDRLLPISERGWYLRRALDAKPEIVRIRPFPGKPRPA